MKCVGHVARIGEKRGAYKDLVGKLEGRRKLEQPRRRWEDFKVDLQETGWMMWTISLRIRTNGGLL